MNLRVLKFLGLVSDWIKHMNICANPEQKCFYKLMEGCWTGNFLCLDGEAQWCHRRCGQQSGLGEAEGGILNTAKNDEAKGENEMA